MIQETFRFIDKRGRGFITTADLRCVMLNIGENLTSDQVDELVEEADINGDGLVKAIFVFKFSINLKSFIFNC